MLTPEEKKTLINTYQRKSMDTGSVEVQVALLTADIIKLTDHCKIHQHDYHSRRGLLAKVAKRTKLLSYLKNKSLEGLMRYRTLINKLGLRDIA